MAWKLMVGLSLSALIVLSAASLAASKTASTGAAGKAAAPPRPAVVSALAVPVSFCAPKAYALDASGRACGLSPRRF